MGATAAVIDPEYKTQYFSIKKKPIIRWGNEMSATCTEEWEC